MRDDFDKVIRERGKCGRRCKKDKNSRGHRQGNLPLDERDDHNPKYYRRENWMYGPVNRYFRKQVGRKWDDVYSEICQANDVRAHPRPQIFQFIDWKIVHPIKDENGDLWSEDGRRALTDRWYSGGVFYVDPDTGVLCYTERQKPKAAEKLKDYVVLDDWHQYHKVRGVWYLVEFKAFGDGLSTKDVIAAAEAADWREGDRSTHRNRRFDPSNEYELRKQYGASIYAASKRQASKKEIHWVNDQLAKEARRMERGG